MTYGITPPPLPRPVVIITVFVIQVRPGFSLLSCMNRRCLDLLRILIITIIFTVSKILSIVVDFRHDRR